LEAGGVYQAHMAKSTPATRTLFGPARKDYLEPMRPRSSLALALKTGLPARWEVTPGLVSYEDGLTRMERETQAIARGDAPELIWLLEHPPLYTAGTSARDADLIAPARFPVHHTGRGGQYTYHGPGQRVAYVMLDLRQRGQDVRAFVAGLESWLIGTLAAFNVKGERREDRVGVWVRRPEKGPGIEDKIAAIGIRVRHGVTFHGISLNVEPDLSHFSGIVPCGVKDHGVTSLVDLGLPVSMADADVALHVAYRDIFG
jgi:lipoyl(octanoyl) transferase